MKKKKRRTKKKKTTKKARKVKRVKKAKKTKRRKKKKPSIRELTIDILKRTGKSLHYRDITKRLNSS